MDLDSQNEKIEQYLENLLEPEDRQSFEVEIRGNPELRALVMNHILAKEAIGILLEDKIREKLSALDLKPGTHVKSKEPVKIIQISQKIKWAAAVLILVTGTWIFFMVNSHTTSNLTQKYYQTASSGQVRGINEAGAKAFQEGLTAFFKENNFSSAISLFEQVPETDSNYIPSRYYLGHSYLKVKSYESALNEFDFLLSKESLPEYMSRDELKFNRILALTNIPDSETEVRKGLEELISGNNEAYRQKAKELEDDLNSFWKFF